MMIRIPILLCIALLVAGCDVFGSKDDDSFELEARTVLTSSSLQAGKTADLTAYSDGSNVFLTPSNVAGEAMSLLFAIAGVPDEGIVIFGDNRPDIAPANSPTYPFNFGTQQAIVSSPSFDPSRPGGLSEHMAVIFSHLDFTFSVNSQSYTVRIALVSNNGMQRGDKLMLVGSSYEWYDLDQNAFTSTRPSNPARITEIENFVDSVRPNMVFYPFNAFMTNQPLSMLTADLAGASGLDIVLNFNVQDMLVLEGVTSTNSLGADGMIQLLTVRQVTEGFGNSGLQVNASATILP